MISVFRRRLAQGLLVSGLMAGSSVQAVVLNPGDIIVGESTNNALIHIDPNTGNRTVLTSHSLGVGSGGGRLSNPSGITMNASGNLVVSDSGYDALIEVNPTTGRRSQISGYVSGSPSFNEPSGIAAESSGDYLVTDDGFGTDGLWRVDGSTGVRTMLSDASTGSGQIFDRPEGVAVDPTNGDIYVVDGDAGGSVFRVDGVTGDRTLVSSASSGRFPGIAFSPSGDLYVVERAIDKGVFRIDKSTGARTLISGLALGSGDAFTSPFFIGAATDDTLYVADFTADSIFSVDVATGARTVVSSASVGTGETLNTIRSMYVVPGASSSSASVPVASPLLLVGFGLLGLTGLRRRRI